MTEKSTTADPVRASMIRRSTGAAAAARAARTSKSVDKAHIIRPVSEVPEAMRTTLQLPTSVRTGLKRLALDADTTMTEVIRAAISVGLQDAAGLATVSLAHRRVSSGVRTTLDLPRDLHRALKRLAADADTSVQALVSAAILQAYPDLA